jgi:hypothetical protein
MTIEDASAIKDLDLQLGHHNEDIIAGTKYLLRSKNGLVQKKKRFYALCVVRTAIWKSVKRSDELMEIQIKWKIGKTAKDIQAAIEIVK